MVEKVIRQVAVRINDADTAPGLNVLENQIAEQGRFTCAAFPDGIEMVPPVVWRKNEGQFLPPSIPHP